MRRPHNNALEVRHFGLVAELQKNKVKYPLLQTVLGGFHSSLVQLFEEIGKLYANQDFMITIEHEDLQPGYPLGFHNLKKKDHRDPNYKPTTPKDLADLVIEKLESFQYSDKVLSLSKKFIIKVKVVGRYYMKQRMRKAFAAARPRYLAKKGYTVPTKRRIKSPENLPPHMLKLYELCCMYSPPFNSPILKDHCLKVSLLLGTLMTLGKAYPKTAYSKDMNMLKNLRLKNSKTPIARKMLEDKFTELRKEPKFPRSNKLEKVVQFFEERFNCLYFIHTTKDRDEIVYPESPPSSIEPEVPIVHIHIAEGKNGIDHASYFEPVPAYTKEAGGKTCIACYAQIKGRYTKHVVCQKMKVCRGCNRFLVKSVSSIILKSNCDIFCNG